MEQQSIFDFTDIGFFTTTTAIKRIVDIEDFKEIRIDIVLNAVSKEQYQLSCVYALNVGGKVSKQKPVKFVVKQVEDWDESLGMWLKEDTITRKRCYLESEIDESTLKDIDIFEKLFDTAPIETKRLY